MQYIIMENTLIKLTLHDETKKRAHDSQIVRAKENLKLSHGGSSYKVEGNNYFDICIFNCEWQISTFTFVTRFVLCKRTSEGIDQDSSGTTPDSEQHMGKW